MIDDQLRGGLIRYINWTFTESVLRPGRLKQVASKEIRMGKILSEKAHSLSIYDILGLRVRKSFTSQQGAGFYRLARNGRDQADRTVASGVYFYRLATAGFSQTRKMTLIK